MKTRIPIRLLAFTTSMALSLACGGCFPYHFTTGPGAKGLVVDARTHAPLAGTKIELATSNGTLPGTDGPVQVHPGQSAVTRPDGTFLIPGRQEWGIYIVPMDTMGWHMELNVDAKGYTSATRKFLVRGEGPAVTDLGTIPLEKK